MRVSRVVLDSSTSSWITRSSSHVSPAFDLHVFLPNTLEHHSVSRRPRNRTVRVEYFKRLIDVSFYGGDLKGAGRGWDSEI